MENNTIKRLQMSKALAYQLRSKLTSGQVLTEDEVDQLIDKLYYMNRLVENAILTEEERSELGDIKEESTVRANDTDSLAEITLIGRSITDDVEVDDISNTGDNLDELEAFDSDKVIERFKDSEEDSEKEKVEDDPYRMVRGKEKEKSWVKKIIENIFG